MNATKLQLEQILQELPLAITITDHDGRIIYMNDASQAVNIKPGAPSLIGKPVHDCHSEHAKAIIEQLLLGQTNAYTISKQGIKKLIYQCPWRVNGDVKGLIEFSIIIPEELPHHVRS